MYCMIKQRRGTLHRVDSVKTILESLIVDIEVLYDVHSLFLNDNLVEHHGAAPHAATRREFAVKLSYLQSCLSQIISSNNTRRTSANNGYIEIEITLKFVKIGTDNTFGYLCFNHFFKVFYFLK